MYRRLVSFCLLIFSIAVLSQQQNTAVQNQTWVWGRGKTMNADPIPQVGAEAVRRLSIHRDAEELSTLSATLQADPQQLQRGVLPKELSQDTKKGREALQEPLPRKSRLGLKWTGEQVRS